MTSDPQPEDVVCESSTSKHDFAVQPVGAKDVVPVDGPLPSDNTTASSDLAASVPDMEHSSQSASSPALALEKSSTSKPNPPVSPSLTPKESIGSDTTLEDGEIGEDIVEGSEEFQDDSTLEEGVATEEDFHEVEAETSPEAGTMNTDKDVITESEGTDTQVSIPEVQAFLETASSGVAENESALAPKPTQNENSVEPSPNDATRQQAEDVNVTSGEEAEVEAVPVPTKRSVPPHMRSDLPSPAVRQPTPSGPKHPLGGPLSASRFADLPRAHRFHGPNNGFVNYNNGGGREEAARLNAMLMKTRNELEHERLKNANMRKSVEEEMQKTAEEALAASMRELLNKQMKTLTQQAKVESKERELQFREDRIEQLEVFLAEGQKFLYRQELGEEGLSISAVVAEHESRQGDLLAKKSMAGREAKLVARLQSLQLRETSQESREAQYKALIRGSFEAELRAKSEPNMKAKLDEVADLEYNRGFGEGKAAGRKDEDVGLRQKGFFEGYDACHRAQVALQNLRTGRIPRDSPELDFLYDASHPFNAYNVGVRNGGVVSGSAKVNGPGITQQKSGPVQAQRVRDQVQEQVKAEESIRKLPPPPPPRPTFASELRGNTHQMHNGHYVLANGSSSSSTVVTPKTAGVNGTDNELYAGRVIRQYEESEEDNLIDLN